MCCQNTFESTSLSKSYWQGKQTIPYLLMTTLKITFYKNIKSVLVSCIGKPSFSYLWWKKDESKVWTEFFHNKSYFLFHKDIDDDECYDFQDELFNFEQILRMSRNN